MKVVSVLLAAVGAAVFGLVGGLTLSSPGYAAEPEEIIVSVRRKNENLQEVPLAVSTIDQAQIERFGINNLADVTRYTPGLQFDEGFGAQDTRVVIRGLSPTRGRSNVALLVDGVDFTGEAVSTAGGGVLFSQQLLDVERVEIVKGPQSALYGRSAFAGAVQYVSKKPSLEETETSINVQFDTSGGLDGGFRLGASHGGPVTDSFGVRVNGLVYDKDGYYKNSVTGERLGGSDGVGLALSGLWDAGGSVTISGRVAGSIDNYEPQAQARVGANAIIDINDSVAVQNGDTDSLIQSNGPPFLQVAYAQCGDGLPGPDRRITGCFGGAPKTLTVGKMPDGDDLKVVRSNDPRTGSNYPGTTVDTISGTLRVNWDVGAGDLTSYTGYAALNSEQFFDGQVDALPAGDYESLDSGWRGGPLYQFTLPPCGFLDCSPTKQELDFRNKTRLFSQELRFVSDLDGAFNYTVGALYWRENVGQDEDSRSISPAIFRASTNPANTVTGKPPAGLNITNVFTPNIGRVSRKTESVSAYALLEFDLSDMWKLSVEGRWIDEELEVTGPVCDTVNTPILTGIPNQAPDANGDVFCDSAFRGNSSITQSEAGGTLPVGTFTKAVLNSRTSMFDDSYFVPKATIEFTPSDTQLFYASIAEGVKPGGISTITAGSFFEPDKNTFDKEKLWSYEIGSKSTLLDGAMVFNAALFYQDYSDKQVGVSRFNPVTGTDVGGIENAAEAEIWGLELEANWQVTDRLSLYGGYSYVNSEYSDFVLETSSANNVARSLAAGDGGCLSIIDNPTPGSSRTDFCVVDLSGNAVEDVPEHSFVGNARYVAPLGDSGLDWYGDVSLIYRDSRYMDELNVKELRSYWLTDVRAGVISDNWELIAFIDNVFDDDTVKTGVDFGSQVDGVRQGYFPPAPTDGVVVSLPDPRVYGVRATFKF